MYRNERMVCGRLAKRATWVMLLMGKLTVETLLSLPKPLSHLFVTSLILCSKRVLDESGDLTKILCPCSRNARFALYPIQVAHQR